MALESGTYIDDLVATNPTGSDNVNDGDNHIRLIKSTIKNTFPNITGAMTCTQSELNQLDGITLGTLATINSPLPVANGGTGATTQSGARTNLGLGSMATQNSSSVSITGGSITGLSSLSVTGAAAPSVYMGTGGNDYFWFSSDVFGWHINNSEKMRISTTQLLMGGSVGISVPSGTITYQGASFQNQAAYLMINTGTGVVTAGTALSSLEEDKNIQHRITEEEALNFLPVEGFRYNPTNSKIGPIDRDRYGFGARECSAVDPLLGAYDGDELIGFDYDRLCVLHQKLLQMHHADIDAIKAHLGMN